MTGGSKSQAATDAGTAKKTGGTGTQRLSRAQASGKRGAATKKSRTKTQRLPDAAAVNAAAAAPPPPAKGEVSSDTQRLHRFGALSAADRKTLDQLLVTLYRALDTQFLELNELLNKTDQVEGKRVFFGLLNLFYEHIQPLIPCHRASVALLDAAGSTLTVVWSRTAAAASPLREGYTAALADTSLAAVGNGRQPRIIGDLEAYVATHPTSDTAGILMAEGMRSSMACPLHLHRQLIGFIFFTHVESKAFGEQHSNIFNAMSERLPLLLDKARLYREALDLGVRAHRLLLVATEEHDDEPDVSLMNREVENILCAHHDDIVRLVLRDVLGQEGYRVGVFKQGDVILDRLENIPCDLVIVGADLPHVSGLDVCSRIRNEFHDTGVSVILILNERRRQAVADAIAAGADDIIFAPVNPTELLAKISLLSQRRAAFLVNTRPAVGSVFAGRYRILDMIGTGGYSTIYHAIEATVDDAERAVALKVVELPAARANDPRYLSRLLREAYGHSRLDHPNVVRLYDFGQVGRLYYLAMEYIQGLSLMQMVENNGPMPEDNLLFIAREALAAMVYLEEHGMMHRDIKAENFMIANEGDVKLLDFGLARRQAESTVSLADEFHGTPQYASPEYILGGTSADIRSDMYSLGVTLYLAASGEFPFEGSSAIEVIRRHVDYTPAPLWQRAQGRISREFSDLVDWMLDKDNSKRPTPTAAMKALLRLSEKYD